MRKKSKLNQLKSFAFIGFLISVLALTLYLNIRQRDFQELKTWEKYIVVGKENLFVVYGNKLAVKVPFEISVNKKETIGEIVGKRNYEEVLRVLNETLPEKVTNYKVVKMGEVDIKAENMKNIPEISLGNRRHILTSSLNAMFFKYYYDAAEGKEIKDITVAILNANGRQGYARESGEKLKNAFSVNYDASNYKTVEQYSYIMNKDLPEEKLKEIILELDEKYFRIKSPGAIQTSANIVVVLGKEQDGVLEISVSGEPKVKEKTISQLKDIGYKNIKDENSSIEGSEENLIEYNSEDYYTAYKLSQKLGIKNMLENKELKNKINVFIK